MYLEVKESPACSVGHIALDVTDTMGTVASVGSTVALIAGMIPAITVAPIVITGAAVTGGAVAAYTIGRNIGTLVERKKYGQVCIGQRSSIKIYIAMFKPSAVNCVQPHCTILNNGEHFVIKICCTQKLLVRAYLYYYTFSQCHIQILLIVQMEHVVFLEVSPFNGTYAKYKYTFVHKSETFCAV